MAKHLCTVITDTASYIPTVRIPNKYFLNSTFYSPDGKKEKYGRGDKKGQEKPIEEIVQSFEKITNIKERRYVTEDLVTSDIGGFVAEACYSHGDNLKQIIFAHNFGDISINNKRSEFVPSLASRVKAKLRIKDPYVVAYDLPFGCPGWLEGVIQAHDRLKKGEEAIVIGAETLSRISDPYDKDSMIYSDGAGAVKLKVIESDEKVGILSHVSRSDTFDHSHMLWMGKSYNPNYLGDELFLKMKGHDLYEHALNVVPGVVKESLDEAGLGLEDVDKILIHQANEKMDSAIIKWLFKLYGKRISPSEIQSIMPMIISELGNNSVATLPTLLDRILRGKLPDQKLSSGDIAVFASIGAGTNINAMVYRMP